MQQMVALKSVKTMVRELRFGPKLTVWEGIRSLDHLHAHAYDTMHAYGSHHP